MKLKSSKKSIKPHTYAKVKSPTDEEVILEGEPCDHSVKHLSGSNIVGASIGVTKNMGDYESLRVDVWATTPLEKGESIDEALDRLQEVLQESLMKTTSDIIGE